MFSKVEISWFWLAFCLSTVVGCGSHELDEPTSRPQTQKAIEVATVRAALTGPADYRSMIMSDGPVSYWRLGELPGQTTASDEMGVQAGTYSATTTDPNPSTTLPYLDMPGAIIGDRNGAPYFFVSHDTAHPHYQDNLVVIPSNANQNLQTFTLECWVTLPSNSMNPGTWTAPIIKTSNNQSDVSV